MSAAWAPLLPLAMVGTDRQATALPPWPGEIGQLIAQATSAAHSPAIAVLRAAAVLAPCSLAGAQGRAWDEPLPAAATADDLPELPAGRVRVAVEWILQSSLPRLQHEACIVLTRAGRRLPAALLPLALELGRRSLAFRPVLHPVLGGRGLWLAQQREDWRYAAGVAGEAVDDNRWSEGSFEQRRELLQRERAAAPEAARERLEHALPELPAKERAELLAVLADRLGPGDEPLLDGLRADRSREVRDVALGLLLRLPEASHPQRALGRITSLLTQERVLLRKRWRIDAPSVAADDWKQDNVDALRPKNESLGERAWWLYQLVRQVPLAAWVRHTGMNSPELLQWALDGEWAEALLRGWRDVLFAAPDTPWCQAMLERWPASVLRHETAAVLALLPLPERERYWSRQLRDDGMVLSSLVQQLLGACAPGETVSPTLSAALVETLKQRVQERRIADDYALRACLPELCCALHPGVLTHISPWPRLADDPPSLTELQRTMTHIASARQALHSLTIASP